VLLHALVFSTEHLSHFKIPKREQEVRLVVQAVADVSANSQHKVNVVEISITGIHWALGVEIRIIVTELVPIIQFIIGDFKEWTDEQQNSNSVNIGKLAMPVGIYKYS
jgi:hypothetical protein